VLVSKYGFSDVLVGRLVVLDPSRVAAQVVTGVGFIGGGLIFVRRDSVRGLTTAAIVWTTAAIGMACGAGLAILALFATVAHFVVVLGYPRLAQALPRSRYGGYGLRIIYEDGRGILRDVLTHCTDAGFSISEVSTHKLHREIDTSPAVRVDLEVRGQPRVDPLASTLQDLPGVFEVAAKDLSDSSE
jgi:putative Mg2+ transporter-C (MgtC) family protein